MNPWLGMALVSGGLLVLLVVAQALTRLPQVDAETRRKFVHVGMGLITASFPWIFDAPWPAWVLAVGATVLLYLVRNWSGLKQRLGRALHGVERQSVGELIFPWAVAIVFQLSNGKVVLHLVPVLLLTLADAAGALVGRRYGSVGFQTGEGGRKTVEGSLFVFLVSFLCAHIPLLLMTELGRAECLVASLTLALLAMIIEGLAIRGWDNLLLPLGSHFLLSIYLGLPLPELMERLLVISCVLSILLATQRWSGLTAGGMLASALLGYGVWALGGHVFLFCLLGVYLRHLVLLGWRQEYRNYRHGSLSVLSLAACCLVWAFLGNVGVFFAAVASFSAIQMQGAVCSGKEQPWLRLMASGIVSILFCLLPMLFQGSSCPDSHKMLFILLAIMFVQIICDRVLPRDEKGVYSISLNRFGMQTVVIGVASTLLYFLL